MKLLLYGIESLIEIKADAINSVVIENASVFYNAIKMLKVQVEKHDGDCVLSKNNEVMDIHKNLELISNPFEIEFNSKAIINKVIDMADSTSCNSEFYEKTMQVAAEVENYIDELLFYLDIGAKSDELTMKQILKASNIYIECEADNLPEQILKYVEVVSELLGKKLFVFVNFRGFIDVGEFRLLGETLMQHDYKALFIDNMAYPKMDNENRITIDIDLCEF